MPHNPGTADRDSPKHGFAALEEARQRSLRAARRVAQKKDGAGTANLKDVRKSPGSQRH